MSGLKQFGLLCGGFLLLATVFMAIANYTTAYTWTALYTPNTNANVTVEACRGSLNGRKILRMRYTGTDSPMMRMATTFLPSSKTYTQRLSTADGQPRWGVTWSWTGYYTIPTDTNTVQLELQLVDGSTATVQKTLTAITSCSGGTTSPTPTPTPTPTPVPQTSSLKLGIPSYWYPSATYDNQVVNASQSIGFTVMGIAATGPGTSYQSVFDTKIKSFRAAGVKVYGYVDTSYGNRSLTEVRTDIGNWYSWYGVEGVMFDQAPGTGWTSAQQTYYRTIHDYVKAKTGTGVYGTTVVLNPGTITDEYAMSVADIVSIYEDVAPNYAGATFPAWTARYTPERFWHLVHSSTSVDQLQTLLSQAKNRNVRYIYITQDIMPNPWDTLPAGTYWSAEISGL